jgi:hypothetical protein
LEEQPTWMSVSLPILISSELLYSEHPAQITEYKQYETGINSKTIKEYIFLVVHFYDFMQHWEKQNPKLVGARAAFIALWQNPETVCT